MRKLLRIKETSPFDIQPDSIVFSDLHLHERKEFAHVESNGLNSRLFEGLLILEQIDKIICDHPSIKNVFFLGDPFELKDKVPNHILIEFQEKMEDINSRAKVIALMGNHDFNIPKYPSTKLFNIELKVKTSTIWLNLEKYQDSERVQIAFIPFQRDFAIFLKMWNEVHNVPTKPNIVFFHQEIPGVTYETGKKIPGIFPNELFNPGTLYMSGHIHKPQKVGQIQFVGSPYQTKFSDEGQERYIWLLNSKTRQYAPIKLRFPEFKSIDVTTQDIITLSGVEGNYLRLVGDVDGSQWDPTIRKELKERVLKKGAKGVSIQVNVIKQRQTQIPQDKIDDNESIIELYVKNNPTNLDSDKLIRIGIDLFHFNK